MKYIFSLRLCLVYVVNKVNVFTLRSEVQGNQMLINLQSEAAIHVFVRLHTASNLNMFRHPACLAYKLGINNSIALSQSIHPDVIC